MSGLANLIHSVRFRLAAWYGFLMIVFMLLAGIGAYSLMGDWLRADLEEQLTASVGNYIESENWNDEQPNAQGSGGAPGDQKFRSLVVQISNGDRYAPVTPFDCQIPFAIPDRSLVGAQLLSTQGACGDSYRVLATTTSYVDSRSGDRLYLVLAQSLTPINDTLATLRNLLLAIGALGVLLALQGGWLIAGRALRPISSVTATASTIAESPRTDRSLAGRLPIPAGNDEVAQLTMTFNRMLDRIEAEFGRRQRFVADASHELRTPLAAIRGNLDVLAMQLHRDRPAATDPGGVAWQEAVDEGFEDLNREAGRMARLLDDLLFLARADDRQGAVAVSREEIRLDELVTDTVRSASGLTNGQRLTTDVAPVIVPGDRDRLSQVLWILLDNALRHTGPGQRIIVSAGERYGQATLAVEDEGAGIAPNDLPHVFDRFFRADEARSRTSGGSGLGLAIAKTIIEQHGGGITVTSEPNVGSRFTVLLPLSDVAAPASGRPVLARPTAAFRATSAHDDRR